MLRDCFAFTVRKIEIENPENIQVNKYTHRRC